MENKSIGLEELKARREKIETEFKSVQEKIKITLQAQTQLKKQAEVLSGQYLELESLIKILDPAQTETPKTNEKENVKTGKEK